MDKRGIGTYLAQGATANAVVTYLLLLGLSLDRPSEADLVMLIVAPIYSVIGGIPGAVVGSLFWLAEVVMGRRLGIFARAATAMALPTLIVIIVSLAFGLTAGFLPIMLAAVPILTITLPAALLSGSRFNPLRSVVVGLEPVSGFGNKFSFPFAMFLRFASVLGMAEVMIFIAQLPPWAVREFTFGGNGFGEVIAIFFYFCVTGLVSFALPRSWSFTLSVAVFINLPLAIWAAQPERYLTVGSRAVAILFWILIGLWVAFVLGRFAEAADRGHTFRRVPVTFFEIRIRHALNWW
jgi:hypothetical protein